MYAISLTVAQRPPPLASIPRLNVRLARIFAPLRRFDIADQFAAPPSSRSARSKPSPSHRRQNVVEVVACRRRVRCSSVASADFASSSRAGDVLAPTIPTHHAVGAFDRIGAIANPAHRPSGAQSGKSHRSARVADRRASIIGLIFPDAPFTN